ncbi:hypothetical protein OEZ85_012926 [Tetradesmus obliquus]|uniref:JmjC domain-containing protein n=1 Tax=Tetradesmus obliquus TaxID=3088 RepID=A0ABY8U4B4_TETOB|nr:hypothetical protein OEZ85_012926 [Tetradesmus obliquus]
MSTPPPAAAAAAAAAAVRSGSGAAADAAEQRQSPTVAGNEKHQEEMVQQQQVAAAGLPLLPAGPGLLVREGKSEAKVCLSAFHKGDTTGKNVKLFQLVPAGKAGGPPERRQLSKSCHDCQEQHVHWRCSTAGCRGTSICNRCLLYRYAGLYSLQQLYQCCPVCRGTCTCRGCLRRADHAKLQPPPRYSAAQLASLGRYSLRLMGPDLAEMMGQQQQEAAAWGVALAEVPQEPLPDSDSSSGGGGGSSSKRKSGGGQQQQQGEQLVQRGELFSIAGAAALSLVVVLAPDLLSQLGRLQQLAQEYQQPPQLQLADCPLLLGLEGQLPLRDSSGAPITLQQLQSKQWWTVLPEHLQQQWRRRANSSSWLFTPHIDDLAGLAPQQQQQQQQQQAEEGASSSSSAAVCALARALFWARWLLGEPVIVRGTQGRIPWDPDTLRRAVRDIKAERSSSKAGGSNGSGSDDEEGGAERVSVLDCEDFARTELTQHEFFKGFKHGYWMERADSSGALHKVPAMLKVKDWPPRSAFRQEMQRHFVDFLACLPLPLLTDPRLVASPLNAASALLPRDNPTDLGPKCYAAYGRIAEADGEGDSVTKLHTDMADAVNLLMYTTPGGDPAAREAAAQVAAEGAVARCGDDLPNMPSYDGAGAVWDICARGSDAQQLSQYLSDHIPDFTHQGHPVSVARLPVVGLAPIASQAFMLSQRHRQQLQQERGVEMWHFEQHKGEAVFIPGGCPHQVRNLASCCKVAVDFVSPESMAQALASRQALRDADLALLQPLAKGPEQREFQEKLQSQLMLLRHMLRADEALQAAAGSPRRSSS